MVWSQAAKCRPGAPPEWEPTCIGTWESIELGAAREVQVQDGNRPGQTRSGVIASSRSFDELGGFKVTGTVSWRRGNAASA